MKKAIIITIVSLIGAGILGVCIYGYLMLNQIKSTDLPADDEELGIIVTPSPTAAPILSPSPSPVSSVTPDPTPVEIRKPDIINIIFFGLDRRNPDEASRSDTIMVVSLDKDNQKVKVSSLMRDMYVPIPGREDNRINAAYAFGGAILALRTINSNFGLDARNYVTVDFFGLEKLIDKIGGVGIDVKANEVPFCGVKGPGLQTLNGMQAVAYSRIRHTGNSDYERTERQRRVLNELFKKIRSQGVMKLPGVINTILPYVETSLSKAEIINLAMEAVGFNTDSIEQFRLPVDGLFQSQRIRGMAVLVPDIEENKNKLHEFIYGAEYVNSTENTEKTQN